MQTRSSLQVLRICGSNFERQHTCSALQTLALFIFHLRRKQVLLKYYFCFSVYALLAVRRFRYLVQNCQEKYEKKLVHTSKKILLFIRDIPKIYEKKLKLIAKFGRVQMRIATSYLYMYNCRFVYTDMHEISKITSYQTSSCLSVSVSPGSCD